MKVAPKKVVYVQPLQTPYNTPRLAALARDSDLEIVVLLEADQAADRPGWASTSIPGCTVEVVGSQLFTERSTHRDLSYEVTETRHIPWRLPLLLRRHNPDIVVVCNATELLFALLAKLFGKFKIVLNVEDTRHTVRHVTPLRAYIKQGIYRRADLHLAFSEQAEEYLKSIGINRSIARTSWSVDVKAFAPDPKKRESIRNRLALNNRVVFLFVGRFIPLKGLMPMLRAWARLAPDVRARAALVLVGDGPLGNEARQFAYDHKLEEVHFLGQQSYDEMPGFFSASDLFIFPTLQDVWGLVVLEAMASGRAVMCTEYCGASYLVKEGVNGWLFDSADESSIQTLLAEAIEAHSDLPAMGVAARESVQRLDTAEVMSSLAMILKRL